MVHNNFKTFTLSLKVEAKHLAVYFFSEFHCPMEFKILNLEGLELSPCLKGQIYTTDLSQRREHERESICS